MKDRKPGSSMAVRLIGSVVLLLAAFGLVVSSLGFLIFTNSIVKEYTNSTYRIADTATSLVNGNHLEAYLIHSLKVVESRVDIQEIPVETVFGNLSHPLHRVDGMDGDRLQALVIPVQCRCHVLL